MGLVGLKDLLSIGTNLVPLSVDISPARSFSLTMSADRHQKTNSNRRHLKMIQQLSIHPALRSMASRFWKLTLHVVMTSLMVSMGFHRHFSASMEADVNSSRGAHPPFLCQSAPLSPFFTHPPCSTRSSSDATDPSQPSRPSAFHLYALLTNSSNSPHLCGHICVCYRLLFPHSCLDLDSALTKKPNLISQPLLVRDSHNAQSSPPKLSNKHGCTAKPSSRHLQTQPAYASTSATSSAPGTTPTQPPSIPW
ncbi:uncharacterized protein EDB93DRAFT_1185373 [Suillus bovinus]|uniref:uncharacterized protein n=1 Tax=Suillus bovinus TaxID=48563 RepID=UPI001B85C751|nr:uncharacterized protein EDB93DRAFT_1185373 [Suillus bovinus]KAG2128054.1 hypothetical protein EDB93DRAFT_1185373 [Suillus bovinus]